MNRRNFIKLGLAAGACGRVLAEAPPNPNPNPYATSTLLNPYLLTKFIDPLPIPTAQAGFAYAGKTAGGTAFYNIAMTEFRQQLHSQLPPALLWGYGGTYPSRTIETRSGQRVVVNWINNLPNRHFLPVDYSIMGTDPAYPVRTVVHLHGARVEASSDGWPKDAVSPGQALRYHYANEQPARTLWFHDHAWGLTRLNVYAGLAGFYLIRDDLEDSLNLPGGPADRPAGGCYEVPIVIQDRTFDTGGQLVYLVSSPPGGEEGDGGAGIPAAPWVPEQWGNTILANGKVWPYLNVEPRRYRLRFLNGSQARFYNLGLALYRGPTAPPKPIRTNEFHQIGTEAGFLPDAPLHLNRILFAPGERLDVIVDFSRFPLGTEIILTNDAGAPYGSGPDPANFDARTTGQLMLFRVVTPLANPDQTADPMTLQLPSIASQPAPALTRNIELIEDTEDLTMMDSAKYAGAAPRLIMGMSAYAGGPRLGFNDPITETPRLNTIEDWNLINTTGDAHPLHVHLVNFQPQGRTPVAVDRRTGDVLRDSHGQVIPVGPEVPVAPNERGWKETIRVDYASITRVRILWDGYPGRYVYHCHILEHEEHDMMRPFEVAR